MKYIGNENAIKYIKSLPKRTKQNWDKLFPDIKAPAADLLSRMLTFNPDKRYTVEECLGTNLFIQHIHILTDFMIKTKNPYQISSLTGVGIISNQPKIFYKIWCMKKVCFIILNRINRVEKSQRVVISKK